MVTDLRTRIIRSSCRQRQPCPYPACGCTDFPGWEGARMAIEAARKAADDYADELMVEAEKYHEEERYEMYEAIESQASAVSCAIERIVALAEPHGGSDE